MEIKTGSTVVLSDAAGIRVFSTALRTDQKLVRGVVLHAGEARPLDAHLTALLCGSLLSAKVIEVAITTSLAPSTACSACLGERFPRALWIRRLNARLVQSQHGLC